MANPAIHVYYKSSDGCICAAQYGEPGNPTEYPQDLNGHDTVLELPLNGWNELPTKETHKVDLTTTPHTVVAMTEAEATAKRNAKYRGITEQNIAKLTAERAIMVDMGFDTTEIDAALAQLAADRQQFSA